MRKFRIVERSKNCFYVQVLIQEEIKTGSFWWRQTEVTETWKTLTSERQTLNLVNIAQLISFKTEKEAIDWIDNFDKYPIYSYYNK